MGREVGDGGWDALYVGVENCAWKRGGSGASCTFSCDGCIWSSGIQFIGRGFGGLGRGGDAGFWGTGVREWR